MHVFFALPFDLNSYKDVFFGILTMDVKELIIVSLCVLELDEVTVGHVHETFGNLILLSLLNQPNWYDYLFVFLLLCSNLFGVKIIYKVN